MPARRFKLLVLTALPVVLLVAVTLGIAGAGGGPSDPLPSTAPSTSTPRVREPTTSPPGAPTRPSKPSRPAVASRIIQWITDQAPLSGGASGPEEEAFDAMLAGDCGHAYDMAVNQPAEDGLFGPERTLYEGAASACLAAFEGRARLWPRAEAAFARLAGRTSRLDCQMQSVYRLLERLVTAHRQDPDARLVKRSDGRRGVLKCPRFLKITPDHGPRAGGYPVRLEGEHLPRVVGVNFGPHHLTAVSEDGRHVVVIAPPADDEGYTVYPDGWPYGPVGNPDFVYDPVAATTRSSTTTTAPPPTPPSSADPPPSSG